MHIASRRRIPETPREEIANSVTHGIGALLAFPATIVLIVRAARYGDPAGIVGVSIFGATLILLYTVSTLYHAITHESIKSSFHVFDHIAIYLLIAGTYTPFTLGPLRGPWGWTLFGLVWGLALLGIILKFFHTGRFKILSVLIYLAMGWLVVIATRPMLIFMSPLTLKLLLAGGLAYTGGILFYASRPLPFNHGLWHLFVLAGSTLHYLAIFTLFPKP